MTSIRKKCDKCGKVTEHSPAYGYCLECDKNSSIVVFKRRIKQYIEWTEDEGWEYDAGEYWLLVPEKMYQMAVDGYSVSEIASEFSSGKSGIYSKVQGHCKDNNLETPFRKTKKRKRKPNGLFCLACNRPLVGNQRKWCHNDDCGGWSDLHPRIVRQCDICLNITETYLGSEYEKTCKGCYSSPEEAKQRIAEWIKQEKEFASSAKKRRERAYKEVRGMDVSTECDDDVFFGYLSIDFSRSIITPSGKNPEDMFEICQDIKKVWEMCNPRFWLRAIEPHESHPLTCPAVGPFLRGPNGISELLAPLEDWEIVVDMVSSWFNIHGDMTTFLTMNFSNWLQTQYVENGRDIDDIAQDVNTTIFRIEFALNKLSIPIREKKT